VVFIRNGAWDIGISIMATLQEEEMNDYEDMPIKAILYGVISRQ
jgi:hypothetical protein